jgi:hypothetical protein
MEGKYLKGYPLIPAADAHKLLNCSLITTGKGKLVGVPLTC